MKKPGWFLILIILIGVLPVNAKIMDKVEPAPLLPVYELEDYYKIGNTEFYKESQGYDRLLRPDETVFIYSQRYSVERLEGKKWKSAGVPISVSATETEITRHYTDYLGTTFNVVHNIKTGKTDIVINSGTTTEYRILWELDGITNTEYKVEPYGINFTSPNDWVYADWSDASQEWEDFTVSDSANGKKLKVTFNIGLILEGETYRLDPKVVDSYGIGNRDAQYDLDALYPGGVGSITAAGQSFNATYTDNITYAEFALQKTGNPTGNAYAVLYAHSGVYGTSSVPTGAPLATSDAFDVSTLTGAWAMHKFWFNTTTYELQQDTKYCIVYQNPSTGTIDGANYVSFGVDGGDVHSGNLLRWTDAWAAIGGNEGIFSVYTDSIIKNMEVNSDTTFSKDEPGWCNLTVRHPAGISNLNFVDLNVNTTGNVNNFTLRWTQATDTFSEVSDPDSICSLNTASTSETLNISYAVISFNFNITGGQSGLCDVEVYSLDDDGVNDTDLYVNEFTFSYYDWDEEVYDIINSAFSFWDITGAMTSLSAYVTGVTAYFTESITNMVSLIVLQFKIVTNVFTWIIRWLTRFVDRIVSMFSIIVQIFNGTYPGIGTLVNLWDVLSLESWVDIIVLIGIFMWLESIIRRGRTQGEIQVILGDLQTVVNILGYLSGLFTTVINIVVDYTFRLFEAIT